MILRSKTILIITTLLFPIFCRGQQVVNDTTIRVGHLDNGMTYYIRHNAKDPKIADFYIAQKVGSILEEPHQRGLAHFLEHMAFNGTKHFRGDKKSIGIRPWCETVGIKFGANLNAYTSVDQTVYNISSAPVTREGIIDSCLLILHDWSNDLLLTDEEIDKERGVIHEEWRSRRTGMAVSRLMENVVPTVYKGTKYEDCLPIGSMDVVDHFKYDALRDYYKKWYRPDLQAIIVVGDIDVDKMEKKIKKLFSKIRAQKNPAKRIYYPVNDNEKMIVAIEKDKEQPIVLTKLYMKRDATPDNEKGSVDYQRGGYIDWLITYMLNQRITELHHQPNPPFISASVNSGVFFISKTKDAFSVQVGCKQDNIKGSMQSVLAETQRVRQHGFTAAELDRAKKKYLVGIERRYAERNKRSNKSYVSRCLNNFLESEPMLSESAELDLVKRFSSEVTLQEVNAAVKEMINNKNQVLTVFAPDKDGVTIPSAEEFENIVLEAESKQYEEYSEAKVGDSLMPNKPKAGSIIEEKDYGRHGVTELKLSNGVEVYIKPTDLSGDQVIFRMFAKGGTSNFPEADAPNFSFIGTAVSEGGVADFEALSIRKMLADKTVKIAPYVSHEKQEISGQSSAKDVETMLQLANLYFTSPRVDNTAFSSMIERNRSLYKNRNASSKVVYNDSLSAILYGDNPRTAPLKLETLDKVDYARIMEMYKELFSNASNFKVLIIGNVNIDSLKPLLCQYIASLPAKGGKTDIADTYPSIRNCNETHVFNHKQATPSALVGIYYTAELPYNPATDLKLDILRRVLQIAYTDSVREEKGGTYGVSVNFDLDKYSKPNAVLQISFRCDPSRYEELVPIVYAQLKQVAEKGPDLTSLSKTKKYLAKQYGQNIKSNDYWNYIIFNELYRNVDFHTGYLDMINNVSGNDIRNIARDILKQNRRLEITMKSE